MPTLSRRPRYQEIADDLRKQIQRGVYERGARLPSFPEMRKQGVSQNTMEKVYGLLEADGLIERNTGSGVYVKEAQPRAAVIGVLGATQSQQQAHGSHLYMLEVLSGVQEAVQERSATVVLLGEDTKGAAWDKVDGALLLGRTEQVLDQLPPGFCVISLLHHSKRAVSVVADDERGAFDATRHLLELGHRRIGFLTVGFDEWSKRRLRGYRKALKQWGIEPDARWVRRVHGDENSPRFSEFAARRFDFFLDGCERTQEWLASDWDKLKLTALLAHNDQTALGVLAGLREGGRSVPREVSVVGFDGTAAEYSHPRLTTVRVPLREIGAQGARLLLQQLEHGMTNLTTKVLPATLQFGDSTGAPAK
jgi:DNA-binding LacI/PurR family transcriptional regulator